MNLTTRQKRICEQVINVFETGSIQGDYSSISIYHDGPHGIPQVTYGRSQTTEYGNLQELSALQASLKQFHRRGAETQRKTWKNLRASASLR